MKSNNATSESPKLCVSRITLAASIVLLFAAGYILVDLYMSMKKRQEIVIDLAMVNDVRYGFFNIEKWTHVVAEVLSRKIDELEISDNMSETLKTPVENALYQLLDNVEDYLNKEKESGNWLERTVRTLAYDIAFDAEKMKQQVPEWANDVISQISAPENLNQVMSFLKESLDSFFDETVMMNRFDINSYITNKYGMENYEECIAAITEKSLALSSRSWKLTWILISTVFVMFALYFVISPQYRTELHYYALLLGVMVLLLGGILTPMIDIDARISEFEFLFLGETLKFSDQVIFFESKSIFDVVMLLVREGNAQTIGVGILIFTFSIIFPGIKFIFSAFAYRFSNGIKKNRIMKFFVLESAKWSMADVMVIAIFMSYIGFSSLIGAQLDYISGFGNVPSLSTHKHTTLQMGFFIFTAYCMSGIAFGYAANEVTDREPKALFCADE